MVSINQLKKLRSSHQHFEQVLSGKYFRKIAVIEIWKYYTITYMSVALAGGGLATEWLNILSNNSIRFSVTGHKAAVRIHRFAGHCFHKSGALRWAQDGAHQSLRVKGSTTSFFAPFLPSTLCVASEKDNANIWCEMRKLWQSLSPCHLNPPKRDAGIGAVCSKYRTWTSWRRLVTD